MTYRWSQVGRAASRRALVVVASLLLAAMPLAVEAQQQPGRTATLTEFAIALDATTAPAGNVLFNVYNRGRFTHELAIVKSDLASGSLPQVNGLADETQVPVIRRITLNSAESSALTTNLTPGKYILLCNRVRTSTTGHYSSGMHIGLEIPATGGATLGTAAPASAQATPVAATATAAPKAASPAAPKTGGAGLLGDTTSVLVVLAMVALAAGATVGARRLGAKAR